MQDLGRKNLPTAMMELVDVIIHLGDARELGWNDILSMKRLFQKHFRGGKHKSSKHKSEAKENARGEINSRSQTPNNSFK